MAKHFILLSDEDIKNINDWASIHLPHFRAVAFLGDVNGQHAKSIQTQRQDEENRIRAKIDEENRPEEPANPVDEESTTENKPEESTNPVDRESTTENGTNLPAEG